MAPSNASCGKPNRRLAVSCAARRRSMIQRSLAVAFAVVTAIGSQPSAQAANADPAPTEVQVIRASDLPSPGPCEELLSDSHNRIEALRVSSPRAVVLNLFRDTDDIFLELGGITDRLKASSGTGPRADITIPPGSCKESLSELLSHVDALGTGSTRADLMKSFFPAEGISTRYRQRFVYRKSYFFFVEVDFDVDPSRPNALRDEDRINAISAPFTPVDN